MSSHLHKLTSQDIEMLKELKKKSTSATWYANSSGGGQVRGPFKRWFNVTPVEPEYEKHCGTASDDAAYAAESMNYLPKLIERIEELEGMLALEDMLRE